MSHSSSDTDLPPAEDPQAAADWRGLGDLVSVTTEWLTVPVEGMHQAIADRWFGFLGRQANPVRRGYRNVTAGIYDAVRMAGSVLGAAMVVGAEAADRRNRLHPLWGSSFGRGVQAIANAVWGDTLEQRESELQIELGLRDRSGRPIPSNPAALARAFPTATGRLVVLLHGLGETENCWNRGFGDEGNAVDLAEVLTVEGFTPLMVRYNSGRRVSDNGRSLSALIEEVAHNWPLPVDEIALVGNSMGGLVVRSAVLAGVADGSGWVDSIEHLVTVGTPHLGAPLEKCANVIARSLRVAPESRPIGEFLDQRSAGIKDLRFGAIRKEDWQEADPAALFSDITEVPLPGHIQQHFVAGVITAQATDPVGVLVGDLIVGVNSGVGQGRLRQLAATNLRVFGKRRHFELARDPAVHHQVRDWLTSEVPSNPAG